MPQFGIFTLYRTLIPLQRRAVCWAANCKWDATSYCWSKSSDDCIQELHWPTIKQRHNYYSICHVHDSLLHRNSLHFHDNHHLSETSTKSHPLIIHPVTFTINAYRFSFMITACKQPVPLELCAIYTVKEVNCVLFCLASLPLKQMYILYVCFVVVILLL